MIYFPAHIIDLARAHISGDESAMVPLHDALLEIGVIDRVVQYHYIENIDCKKSCALSLNIACELYVGIENGEFILRSNAR